MRSDTPKVLHTLAGRSMLWHALHSVAKVAPSHVVVLLGHDRDQVAPAVAELTDELGRPRTLGAHFDYPMMVSVGASYRGLERFTGIAPIPSE